MRGVSSLMSTEEGELRLWGRGYGTRLAIQGAEVSERLVDIYAGAPWGLEAASVVCPGEAAWSPRRDAGD